jgi:uncharacterized protein (UPF0261 family)
MLDGDDQPFCDRVADQAMFDAIKHHVRADIPIEELDANINDPVFAAKAVEMMLDLLQRKISSSKISQSTRAL